MGSYSMDMVIFTLYYISHSPG
jgi:hypothetical protein